MPAYRGASPLQSVFLHNETSSGITVMRMDAGLDTGPMLATLPTPLHFAWTVLDLIEWMKQQGPKFLNKTMWER
ncbi:MAG: hypothetical protein H6765_11215 [Candidatus Peribacteria bacterium]|nr:MAG: hypothetical protein H6765_11215 [Candidatus Peribacteria bacterium]